MDFGHVVLGKAEPSLSINLSKNPPKEKDTLSLGSKHPLIEKYLKQLVKKVRLDTATRKPSPQ